VLAVTGVGTGDVVAGCVSGSRFAFAVAWAALAGTLVKYLLTEALARWQLATGTTLLEGWVRHLGRGVLAGLVLYLAVWSFVVAGALISASGLAAHALAPGLSVGAWGVIHSLAAAALILAGGYGALEWLMKLFVGLMFVTLVGTALVIASPAESLALTISEAAVPPGAGRFVLATIGGVGGSVTLLSYGYWIREKGWEGRGWLGAVRFDLAVAYLLTGLFGLAVIVLAARSLHGGATLEGPQAALRMAGMLEPSLGAAGRLMFLVGFWGAVFTSILGVWQSVPWLFCELSGLLGGLDGARMRARLDPRGPWYRAFLGWLAVPPLALLALDRPVGLIVLYTVLGAMFMPFLSATLLYLNARRHRVGELANGWLATSLLALTLALFLWLGAGELAELLR
jgi:Mn2+/Fe2+ NRAMP family transporter